MKYDKSIDELEQEVPVQQYKESVTVIGRGSGKSSLHEKAYQEYLDSLAEDEEIKQQLREEVETLVKGFQFIGNSMANVAKVFSGMGLANAQELERMLETPPEEHDTGMNRQEAFGKLLGNDWRNKNRRNYLKGRR
jgi:hypothetical protein